MPVAYEWSSGSGLTAIPRFIAAQYVFSIVEHFFVPIGQNGCGFPPVDKKITAKRHKRHRQF
jgi:hypothetical protein